MTLDRGVYVAARLNDEGLLRLRSLDQELVVDLAMGSVGDRGDPTHGWAAYPLGVWLFFDDLTGHRCGVDLVFGGDLPLASGLSSSAAIEVATAVALDSLHNTGLGREELAILGHRAETEFVGLQCGIMDQYASALGRSDSVLLLHCEEPAYEHVPLDPETCEVLLMDTRKPRSLADTGFNQRVTECSEAHAILRDHVRDLSCLAAYQPEDLKAAAGHLQGVHLMRARHVVSEMRRIADGVAALRRGEIAQLGESMNGSHRSATLDYEVSCEELDVITDAARGVEGVYGSRMTGAGFGGCAIALVRPGCADAVVREVSRQFTAKFGVQPHFDKLRPGSGPGEVE
jgi:galactokinase